jgi:hypothetical protein
MGNENPNFRWVTYDDKLWSSYSSSRSMEVKSLCFFLCLGVVCSLMEQRECVVFNDGVGSLLHDGWSLWGM